MNMSLPVYFERFSNFFHKEVKLIFFLFIICLSWSVHADCLSFPADFPKERVPVVLAPLLYPESQDISPDK